MKLNEVTGEDEIYLKSAGIQYKFEKDYQQALFDLNHTKSFPLALRANAYNNTVKRLMYKINKFIDICRIIHVPEDDVDLLRANEIYNELSKIPKP